MKKRRAVTEVVIAGIGQTPVGEHWGTPLRTLAVQAIRLALGDSGGMQPEALYAGNTLAANLSRQAHVATLLADQAGLSGIEALTCEAGGASGAAALRQGYLAIRSGLAAVVLVAGVEKFTDLVGPDLQAASATLTDSEYESVHGLTPAAQAAMLARRYIHTHRLPEHGLAGFPLTAHANGAGNRNAMYRKAVPPETYRQAEKVCEPLNIYDVAPEADGAAALVLTRGDLLPESFPHPIVRLAASASASDPLGLHARSDPLDFAAARRSVAACLESAGLRREQIDLFEYFDSFSICAALSLEAAGFAAPGQGWKLAAEGAISLKGQIPCATLGGLKARGNPLGATGVYQAVEAVLQLRGQAGANQIAGAKTALIQALSGPASLAVTHVLQTIN